MKKSKVFLFILFVGIIISSFFVGYFWSKLDSLNDMENAVYECIEECHLNSNLCEDYATQGFYMMACDSGCFTAGIKYMES